MILVMSSPLFAHPVDLLVDACNRSSTEERSTCDHVHLKMYINNGYGLRESTALPCSKSTGTETCMCTISHVPLIFRKHAVQRSQKSVFCPVFKVALDRLRLRVKAMASPTGRSHAGTS